MPSENGRLSTRVLGPITKAANGEASFLRKDAARAFMAMNAESELRFGITLRAASARVAYRTFEEQSYFWDQYKHHGGNLAAQPGMSNHGLGLAVDFATQEMRWIIDQIGEKYGFAKHWSDAASEWWHIKWREGKYQSVDNYYNTLEWSGYTDSEKRWIQEYDKLKAAKKDVERRRVLRRAMKQQRKKIWQAAQDSGWDKANRKARYNSLLTRTS